MCHQVGAERHAQAVWPRHLRLCTRLRIGVDGRSSASIDITSTSLDRRRGSFTQNNPDTDAWYVKPFWRKTWSPLGATTLYGEYGQYNDQLQRHELCSLCGGVRLAASGSQYDAHSQLGVCATSATSKPAIFQGVFVTGSEVQRWGLGVVQEIDSAAMHVWARWQHQEIDVDLTGFADDPVRHGWSAMRGCSVTRARSTRASTIGICSRSVASSSSKPHTGTHIQRKPPFGAASFLCLSAASKPTASLVIPARRKPVSKLCLFPGSGVRRNAVVPTAR